jgi:hypothetical protein
MKNTTMLLLFIFCFIFSANADGDKSKSKSYKCKHIGVQKIKNKKFKNIKKEEDSFKQRYEMVKTMCEFIPIRSPRYCFHTNTETTLQIN